VNLFLSRFTINTLFQPVKGMVDIRVEPGKRIEHLGIKIELLGQTGKTTDLPGFVPINKSDIDVSQT
jgi:hypothetical protein